MQQKSQQNNKSLLSCYFYWLQAKRNILDKNKPLKNIKFFNSFRTYEKNLCYTKKIQHGPPVFRLYCNYDG